MAAGAPDRSLTRGRELGDSAPMGWGKRSERARTDKQGRRERGEVLKKVVETDRLVAQTPGLIDGATFTAPVDSARTRTLDGEPICVVAFTTQKMIVVPALQNDAAFEIPFSAILDVVVRDDGRGFRVVARGETLDVIDCPKHTPERVATLVRTHR
jgi:hypothetical protein